MTKLSPVVKELLLTILTLLLAIFLFLYFNPYLINFNYTTVSGRHFIALLGLAIFLSVLCIYFWFRIVKAEHRHAESVLQGMHHSLIQWDLYPRLFHLTTVLILLMLTEVYLQNQGNYPGSYYKSFRLVDELEDYSFQFSDSTGLIRIDKSAKYLPATNNYVNRAGFRSKYEFDSSGMVELKKTGRKRIMFIGDSFTEGSSALPRDSCFVDLIDGIPEFAALNFGMYATDPLQYELVASQYIPMLKPEVVVVVTCGNDLMQYDRKPTPGISLYYSSNAFTGDLWEAQKPIELGFAPNDILKSKEEAYEFYKTYCAIPQNNFIGRLFSKSVITTMLWQKMDPNIRLIPKRILKGGLPFTYNHLKKIKFVCDSLNIPVLFFHIPEIEEFSKPTEQVIHKYSLSFKDLPVHYITGLSIHDHVSTDGDVHFNNRGHAKFAAFVATSLDSLFHPEVFRTSK